MLNLQKKDFVSLILCLLLVDMVFSSPSLASSAITGLVKKQSVYVAIYSHIYHGNKEKPFDLAATLSIRNTDLHKNIRLLSVDYFDSKGSFLRKYVDKPTALKSLATTRYVIKSSDTSGGSGAKFL